MKKTGLLVLLLATAAWAQTLIPSTFPGAGGHDADANSFPSSAFRRPPTPTLLRGIHQQADPA